MFLSVGGGMLLGLKNRIVYRGNRTVFLWVSVCRGLCASWGQDVAVVG
uniref:Uncharacterized protein n=1 Tax=Manihot esculenta TaxID=3983 RepID=A0A2C9VV55_MANES